MQSLLALPSNWQYGDVMSLNDTAKPNLHELTRKQHVHAWACWRKFLRQDGSLDCLELASNTTKRIRKRNASQLVAIRSWDQTAETQLMANGVEKCFFEELEQILTTGMVASAEAISAYYLLWSLRLDLKHNPLLDTVVSKSAAPPMTTLDANLLEKRGYVVVREKLISGHHSSRVRIQVALDRFAVVKPHIVWSVWRAGVGQFLVPDGFPIPATNDFLRESELFFPISPTLALINTPNGGSLSSDEVRSWNAKSIAVAREFVFAQDLSSCPH